MTCEHQQPQPVTAHLALNEHSGFSDRWTGASAFSAIRLQSSVGLPAKITKTSPVRAVLVSVPLKPLAAGAYQLWLGQQHVRTSHVPAFHSNVIDFEEVPVCWAGLAFDYVHYQVPYSAIEDVAEGAALALQDGFRPAVLQDDLVLGQLTRSVLPLLGRSDLAGRTALDTLESILAAHILERYIGVKRRGGMGQRGLATWQRTLAVDLLLGNLEGSVTIGQVARECGLSVSHFARCFKETFGVSCHQWLLRKRIELAQRMMLEREDSLSQIAVAVGFGDQAAFTRTFRKVVGASPGHWRSESLR
jgi:AraC family transcriptional regulator